MKEAIKRLPIVGPLAQRLYWKWLALGEKPVPFKDSSSYWEQRYSAGRDSGPGSYGQFAEFKAEVLNHFVSKNAVQSVIEFGCGDGNQLSLATYPSYIGLDVSSTAVARCRDRFKQDLTKSFRTVSEYAGEKADLALSLDVTYHLVEDRVFANYMHTLFNAANRFVIIYSSDTDDNRGFQAHIKHRKITRWIAENERDWRLVEHIPNRYPYRGDEGTGSFADFLIYGGI